LRDLLSRSSPSPGNTEGIFVPSGAGEAQAARAARKDPYGDLPTGAFAGYATATVFHTDAELALDNKGQDFGAEFDLGLSDAAHSSVPVPAVTDELGRKAIPALDGDHSFGQGRGITLPAVYQDFDLGVDLNPAVAKAPPSAAPVRKSASTDLDFVKADSFVAEALARAIPTGCVIGDDLARGLGAANKTDVDPDGDFDHEDDPLLSLSTDDPPPPRAVSQSISRVALSPKPLSSGHFGALAESRLTVAPITFGIRDPKNKKNNVLFTLELAGEYALRAVADGQKGKLFFGPDPADDSRPVARLFQNGKEIGGAGFGEIVPIKIGDETVAEIRIGDDPHPIGADSNGKPVITGTRVAAAADVAVVRLAAAGAEQHIGHMEVELTVPADGVACPGITLNKRSEPATVTPGAPFGFTIDVSNPNDCLLSNVKVKDSSVTGEGVGWKVLTTLPRSTVSREGTLTFEFESLRAGEHKTITINAEAADDSLPGTVSNEASATGVCGNVPMAGAATAITTVRLPAAPPAFSAPPPAPRTPSVPPAQSSAAASSAAARASAQAPSTDISSARVNKPETSRSGSASGALPRTGAALPAAVALPLILTGRLLRRFRRANRTVSE
jgi:hypothetical protein